MSRQRLAALSLFVFAAAGAVHTAALGLADGENPKNVVGKVPPIVEPGAGMNPPSDAIVLFDGSGLDAWQHANGSPGAWEVASADGTVTVAPGKGDLYTKQKFGDIQLHLEWRAPPRPKGFDDSKGSESLGNSGIKFHGAYELQILDSYQLEPHRPSGMAAAVYKQHVPLVNACRAPGVWQTFDIVFRAPWFDDEGKLRRHGTLTVFHNGVLVHEKARIWGRTNSENADPRAYQNAFFLQDHGDRISYRNIWVRELEREPLAIDEN